MLHQKRLDPVVVTLLADPIGNGQGGLGHLVAATSLARLSVRFATPISISARYSSSAVQGLARSLDLDDFRIIFSTRAIAGTSGEAIGTPLAGRWTQHLLGKKIQALGDQPGLAGQTGVAGQAGVEVALRFEEHPEDAQMLHNRIQLPWGSGNMGQGIDIGFLHLGEAGFAGSPPAAKGTIEQPFGHQRFGRHHRVPEIRVCTPVRTGL